MQHHTSTYLFSAAIAAVALGVGAVSAYGYTQLSTLSERVVALEATLASTTALLVGTIEETQTTLSQSLTEQKQQLESQLGSISGTVGTLEKLAKTDPELLAKYSKVFFLSENYAPERVVSIDEEFLYHEGDTETIHASVWPKLEDLLEDAKDDDIELYILSGYRSFEQQRALKSAYTVTYGAGSANAFSADQGYSEHQLGTTVDFITTGTNGQLPGFDKTEAYEWLLDHAHKYGFILSYPHNNGNYIFEPWHWRYVGVDLATRLHRNNEGFYDLDQRDIDKYLADVFD